MGAKRQSTLPQTTITGDDVARRAGVSRAAVSYVLNGTQNTHVSEETRAKVLQAAQELGYHPSTTARALSKGYSEEICVISNLGITPFFMDMLISAQQQAALYGYTPVLYLSQGMSRPEKQALNRRIFARRPIGIITDPLHFTSAEIQHAHARGVQHILFMTIEAEQRQDGYLVALPTHSAGQLAARHLLERGHRHLALVEPDDKVQTGAFAQRREGMLTALAGVPDGKLDILSMRLDATSANEVVETYFMDANRPTGVYAFNDEYALALMAALMRRGIRVPHDVALVGTDDLPMSAYVWPTLTTIRFDGSDIGKRMVDLLHTLHQGQPLPEELSRPLIPELIVRESS